MSKTKTSRNTPKSISQFTQEELKTARTRILQTVTTTDPNECWLCLEGCPKKNPKGYATIWVGIGKNRNRALRHIVMAALASDEPLNGELDVSHLCGQCKCVNPSHLIQETHKINLSRKRCHQNLSLSCSHSPACIRPKARTDC